jgi:hypothetical protein
LAFGVRLQLSELHIPRSFLLLVTRSFFLVRPLLALPIVLGSPSEGPCLAFRFLPLTPPPWPLGSFSGTLVSTNSYTCLSWISSAFSVSLGISELEFVAPSSSFRVIWSYSLSKTSGDMPRFVSPLREVLLCWPL